MYDESGDFGLVNLVTHKCETEIALALSTFTVAGWHECNDLYNVNRISNNFAFENEYILLVTISGTGVLQMNGQTYTLTKNSSALIKAVNPNIYYTQRNCTWEFYFLHFTVPNMDVIYDYLLENEKLVQHIHGAYEIADQIQNIIDIKNNFYTDIDFKCSSIISKVVHLLLERSKDTFIPNPMIVDITRYMRDHYAEKFTLQDLVDKFYVSKNYLCSLFKKQYYISPYAYMTKIRIEESKKKLLMSNMSIAQIAKQCGFSSPNNFISTFKKIEGITPNRFKKEMII